MAKINILDSSIFNRIAAGEVVESPCSVVKELVENSIDSGATKISVEIAGGGIDLIKVTDNGSGIASEDVPKAFLPHATSKIKTIDDLNAISFLGFRGEALPSIASVSNVTLTSKQNDTTLGSFINIENGKTLNNSEIGCPDGTTVIVKDLFKNVPARRKFLKKASSEANKIKELVKSLILANPKLSIKLISDEKIVYSSDGSSVESAIFNVYGNIIDNLTQIENSGSGVKLTGFVSNPTYSKHNRNAQTLVVNNRVVSCEDLSYSIYLVYKDYLMSRQYPAYILYIDIPNDLIDVNVHPNKMSVKFVDTDLIKRMIYKTLKDAIDKRASSTDLFTSFIPENTVEFGTSEHVVPSEKSTELYESSSKASQLTPVFGSDNKTVTSYNQSYINYATESSNLQVNEGKATFSSVPNFANKIFDATYKIQPQDNVKNYSTLTQTTGVEIIGKVFNTYIIVQNGNDMYMIDQHAAHERLLYDKLIDKANSNNAVQDLLIPYPFNVEEDESEYIIKNLDTLKNCGFIIKQSKGNKFEILGVPSLCTNINLSSFVNLLLEDNLSEIKTSNFIESRIAQSACKSAVKGKDDLSQHEIECLLEQMKASGGVLQCPHGRPTVIKLSKTDIEKMFKRIV